MLEQLPDDALMQQFRDGDLLAFQELYRRYKDELYRYIWWRSPLAPWVDEIVQDSWANLRMRHRYQHDASFRTSLYLLARSRLIDLLVEHQHLLPQGTPQAKDGRAAADVLADAMRLSTQRPRAGGRWVKLVDALPSESKEVVVLLKFNAMSLLQIAEIVGVPLGTVRERLREAVFLLRPALPGAALPKPLRPGEKIVNDVDKAALDAFLHGADALSMQLQSILPVVAAPHTDTQIIKRVTFALDQEAYAPLPAEVAYSVPLTAAPSIAWQWWPIALVLLVLLVLAGGGLLLQRSADPQAIAQLTGGAAAHDAPARTDGRQTDMVAHSSAPNAQQNATQYPQGAARVVTGQAVEGDRSTSRGGRPAEEGNAQADKWLDVINDLLKSGLKYEAVEEWGKFRAANPDYPVAASMLAKIEAARNK